MWSIIKIAYLIVQLNVGAAIHKKKKKKILQYCNLWLKPWCSPTRLIQTTPIVTINKLSLIRFERSFCSWTASSEFGTYHLCEQRRFRRACASAQSRQNLRCSLIQAVSQEEPSDRKPDPWPLWMAGHAQLKFVMTECSKTQIRMTGLSCCL